jgi:hypothetical protein
MQVAATGPREHEQPMSWARALVLATGFFFIAAIFIGQLPGYFYTTSTLGTLSRFEQGTSDLGLLAVGAGLIALEIAFLYDPRPLIPWPLFGVVGAGIAAIGGFFLIMVYTQQWSPLQPATTQGWFGNPIWIQNSSFDLRSVGMIALLVGGAMILYAVLCRPVLSGALDGAAGALLVRLCLVAAGAIVAVYITIFTFSPHTILGPAVPPQFPLGRQGEVGNALLFIALGLALAALQIWLLPIMVRHRQQFMPAVYLHGVVGLIGNVGVPLLVIWALTYPVVYAIHSFDSTQFLVQCSDKTVIPGSCTFTPYTGYIITALVIGLTFQLLALAIYFWSTRRNTVILGAVIGLVYLGIAATIIHVDDPAQLPLGLFVAICVAFLAFAFAWASQREFSVERAEALGCTGQWLVLGTGLLIYLAGFSVFSFPNFFESEALGLNYNPGSHLIHDAFWGALLMGGLAAMQLVLLTRRVPMSQLRKFIMWTLLVSVALELVGAIQGFHSDILAGGWDVAEGSHAVFFAGVCFEVVGVLAALFGAGIRASSLRWFLVVLVPALVGGAGAYVAYSFPGDRAEIVVFCFILCTIGAFAYAVAGPDWALVPADGTLAVGTHE